MGNANSPKIRIITLWQPWASLVALGLKQYETRSWSTTYRGKLAIHAAKRPFVSADGSKSLDYFGWTVWLDALKIAHELGVINEKSRLPFAHQLPLGCIVAIVDLADCLPMTYSVGTCEKSINCFEEGQWRVLINAMTLLERAVGDWREDRYAWKLKDVLALPEPIPFKGGQGLRSLTDADALAAIERFHTDGGAV